MPQKRKSKRSKKAVIIQDGEGFLDWVKKANSYLKDNKVISRGANAVNVASKAVSDIAKSIPVPIASTIGTYADKVGSVSKQVGDTAAQNGYGKKRGVIKV